jgi:hypothetical protein
MTGDKAGSSGLTINPPLRIALFIDRWDQPAWVCSIIESLAGRPELCSVVLVVKGDHPPQITSPNRLVYRLYTRLDQFIFSKGDHILRRRDVRSQIGDVDLLEVVPRRTKFSDYFAANDIAYVRARNIDVGLRFGFRIMRGDILTSCRWGIWSYHHGDYARFRGGPPGFWEVFEGHPVTGSILQQLSEDLDAGNIIQRSYAATNRTSVIRNQDNYYRKSIALVLRALERLADGPEAFTRAPQEGQPPKFYSYPLYRPPMNYEMIRIGLRHFLRLLGRRLPRLWSRERWTLGIGKISGDGNVALYRVKKVQPPPDVFWADPFPVRVDGRLFILIEEFPIGSDRGYIAAIEVDERRGEVKQHRIVLRESHHLSYPFVVEHGGAFYLVPEASQSGRVAAYRAVDFPWTWELDRVIIDTGLVDPTLLEHDGRWWLFGNLSYAGASVNDELHAFYGSSPFGPWTPHPMNPVRSDVRGARPAGAFIRRGERLFRPGQDCSERYGGSIILHEVHLEADCYRETPIARIDPRWDPRIRGIHTLNISEDRVIFDLAISELRRPAGFGRARRHQGAT